MTVGDVVAAVDRDRVFYEESGGGVTFSGGEPLMQADFLLACLRACRAFGLHTAVDTCGYAPWSTLEPVAEATDLLLYDIKIIEERRHHEFTGVSNGIILDNLRRLAAAGRTIWVRVPLIPGVNDEAENVDAIAAFLCGLQHRPPMHLLLYHRIGSDKYARLGRDDTMSGFQGSTRQRVQEISERLAALGLTVKVGG